MATALPKTVRDAWGEEAAGEFAGWLEVLLQERTVIRSDWLALGERYTGTEGRLGDVEARLTKVEVRLDEVESRLTKVEVRLDEVESRLTKVEMRLDNVERELGDLKLEVRALRTTMDDRFDRLRHDMDERLDRFSAQFDLRFDSLSQDLGGRMDELHRVMVVQMRWTVGVLALFGTMVTALLAASQLRP
jgi:chromosome segregation ATPase